MSVVLIAVITLVAVMPMVAHAMSTNVVRDDGTDGSVSGNTITKANGSTTVVGTNNNGQLTVTKVNENSNGYTVTTTTYNSNAQPVSQTTLSVSRGQTVTTTNTNTIQTITKTYTQYIYDTYEVDHYIYEYMYPIIQWVFTLTNIGTQQQAGYHSIGSEKLFTPGFGGGNGIFVLVYAQEAVYAFNIAPSTKPQITGWYVGSTSQSTSGPRLISKSTTPPQLTSIQQTVNTIRQQASYTVPNITKTTTYWNYNTINNTQIVSITKNPYYYSPQDIATAYLTGSLYISQAGVDLMHGNIIGAAQSFGAGLYNYLKGAYMQAYNFGAGVINTLAQYTYNPQNPQSIAHALSTGNILNAVTTGASMIWNALTSGWAEAFGFG